MKVATHFWTAFGSFSGTRVAPFHTYMHTIATHELYKSTPSYPWQPDGSYVMYSNPNQHCSTQDTSGSHGQWLSLCTLAHTAIGADQPRMRL